jgi:hypothetical protein
LPGQFPNQTKPNNSCWETATTVWLASQLPGQFSKPNQTKPSKYCYVAGFLIARPEVKPSFKKPTKHSIVGCFYYCVAALPIAT